MASTRLKTTKDGRRFFEIRAMRKDGREASRRWYVPEGWTSQRKIDNALSQQAAEFEKLVKAGEILSRQEQQEQREREQREQEEAARAAAQIRTFKQYAEEIFLPSKKLACAPGTVFQYSYHLDNYLYPFFADIKLSDFSSAMIKAHLLKLGNQGLGYSTLKIIYAILKGIFGGAAEDETIPDNPMLRVPGPKRPKDNFPSDDFLEADQIVRILEHLKGEPLIWQAYIRVSVDTGARKGEILALTWKDINFTTGEVIFSKSKNYNPKDGVFTGLTKCGKSKVLFLTEETISILRAVRREQLKTGNVECPFPLNPAAPNHYIKQFCKRYGLPFFHPHTIRHTFATLSLANGEDITSVSQALGHSSPVITLAYYSHTLKDSNKRVCDTLQKVLKA